MSAVPEFKERIFGKCILAGEHAVLRGSAALVVPVKGSYLDIEYFGPLKAADEEGLQIECFGEQSTIWDVLCTGVIDKACEKLSIKRCDLKGKLKLTSNLNLGAGMGASASLCVGVAKWLDYLGYLDCEIYDFARSLEDIFHGESSGVDIAVALEARAIRFSTGGKKSSLKMNWSPNLYLSYSGNKGITSECVAKVKRLFDEDQGRAKGIDESMSEAVEMMQESLEMGDSDGLKHFIGAMKKAADCFDQWDLLEGGLSEQMSELDALGALATKPTGSGNGGYVLSCWEDKPPKSAKYLFIPVG